MSAQLTEAQNKIIADWTNDMFRKALPASIRSAGIRSSKKSTRIFRLGRRYKKDRSTGAIVRIGFTMDKAGVFREKGVGRGRGIGSGKEISPPWFNPTIDKFINDLADDIAATTGDVIATEKVKIR